MVRAMVGSAALALGLAGPAAAQGFSAGGVGGVAALRGATASPGIVGDVGAGDTSRARAVAAPEPVPVLRRRMAPAAIDLAPWDARIDPIVLPF